MRNERTGTKAASIAGRILERISAGKHCCKFKDSAIVGIVGGEHYICDVNELKILAASALTQAPDKPKKKAK